MPSEGAADRATPISGCVIAYQEEDRIGECVQSLAFCDEVVVVDSGSTDRTVERAVAEGARVLDHQPFPGHCEQKQFAVDAAAHDWVLCLDADERVTAALRDRLVELRRAGLAGAAYEVPRRNHYLGRVVRRGLFWPDRKVRLFDRRRAHWAGTNPHDRVAVEGGGVTPLDEAIEHLSYRDLREHLRKIDQFTAISVAAMYRDGRRGSVLDLLVRPPSVMFKSLVLKRGFIDGWRGLLIAVLAGYYVWLKYWRLLRRGRS